MPFRIFGVGLVLATNAGWVPIATVGGLVMVGIWLAHTSFGELPMTAGSLVSGLVRPN